MRPLVAGIVLMLVLAGCSGTPLAGEENSEPRTVNPRLEGTPTTEKQEQRPTPPGISANETDAWALGQTHRRTLANTSRTVIRQRTFTAANGTILANTTLIIRANGSRRFVGTVAEGDMSRHVGIVPQSRTYWTNGTQTVERVRTAGGNISYDAYPGAPTGSLGVETTGWSQIYGLAAAIDPVLVETTGTGADRRFVLEGTAELVDRPGSPEGRNASLRMVVTPEGVVTTYRLRYETRRNGIEILVTERFRVTAVGSTPAARPGWFEEALAEERKRGGPDRS